MVKPKIDPKNNLLNDISPNIKKVQRKDEINHFRGIYDSFLKDKSEKSYFFMYYGIGGIGKSVLCDQIIDEFKNLDYDGDAKKGSINADKSKDNDKKYKLTNFFAKINLDGGKYTQVDDFLFELRKTVEINAKKYNKLKLEFPTFDTCYAIYWEKKYPNKPLLEKTESTDMGGVIKEIISKGLDSATMGLGGVITEIASVGIEKIKGLKYWQNRSSNELIENFKNLDEIYQMEKNLPQTLAIDIVNNLSEHERELFIFVDTYEAIFDNLNTQIDTLSSGEMDYFFREFVSHIIELNSRVFFAVFGREKLLWNEIDTKWDNIINFHKIGKLSDEETKKLLKNAEIPDNLVDHIAKIADGYPLYLNIAIDNYNKLKPKKTVSEEDFKIGDCEIVSRLLHYSNKQEIFKALSIPKYWNRQIYEYIVEKSHILVGSDYFDRFHKYSFVIKNSNGYYSIDEIMRKYIVAYILENEQEKTIKLIEKLINYHSDFELKHPDDITPEILFNIEQKLYLERYIDIHSAIDNFLKYFNIIESGAHYQYLNDILSDIINWKIDDRKQLSELFDHLGSVNSKLSNIDKALEYYKKSLKIFEDIGDKAAIATALGKIGLIYDEGWGNNEEAIKYYEKSLEIKKELGDKAGITRLLNNIGNIYVYWGKYDEAMENYENSQKICIDIGDKAGIASSLMNIGNIHYYLGKYDKALEYYEKSLGIKEEIGDKADIAISLNNIGNVYSNWGKYDKALEYYEKSLSIRETIGDEDGIMNCLNNIAVNYGYYGDTEAQQSKYEDALKYYEKALNIYNKIGDNNAIYLTLSKIGDTYYHWGKYDRAIEYHKKILKINEEFGDKVGIANSFDNIGLIYKKWGKYDKAIEYYRKSLKIYEELGGKVEIAICLGNIGLIYDKWNKYDDALQYHEKSLKEFEELGDKANIADVLMYIGNNYINQNKTEKGMKTLYDSLKIAKEINYQELINDINKIFETLNNEAK